MRPSFIFDLTGISEINIFQGIFKQQMKMNPKMIQLYQIIIHVMFIFKFLNFLWQIYCILQMGQQMYDFLNFHNISIITIIPNMRYIARGTKFFEFFEKKSSIINSCHPMSEACLVYYFNRYTHILDMMISTDQEEVGCIFTKKVDADQKYIKKNNRLASITTDFRSASVRTDKVNNRLWINCVLFSNCTSFLT